MITNKSSLCKNTLTYLSAIRKYCSSNSTSYYVCTRRHVGSSQKQHYIDGVKNGAKWQMLPNVRPTFSNMLLTCHPTRQCCVKIANANIRQTQLSYATFLITIMPVCIVVMAIMAALLLHIVNNTLGSYVVQSFFLIVALPLLSQLLFSALHHKLQ